MDTLDIFLYILICILVVIVLFAKNKVTDPFTFDDPENELNVNTSILCGLFWPVTITFYLVEIVYKRTIIILINLSKLVRHFILEKTGLLLLIVFFMIQSPVFADGYWRRTNNESTNCLDCSDFALACVEGVQYLIVRSSDLGSSEQGIGVTRTGKLCKSTSGEKHHGIDIWVRER